MHQQIQELMSQYGKIDILWLDYSSKTWQGEKWQSDKLMAMIRKQQPGIIINNRLYAGFTDLTKFSPAYGDFSTPDLSIPLQNQAGSDWEFRMSMNGSSGYTKHDQNWKPSQLLLRNLIDITSKGGNSLLNAGPKADGTFPEATSATLNKIGQWLQTNGLPYKNLKDHYTTYLIPLDLFYR